MRMIPLAQCDLPTMLSAWDAIAAGQTVFRSAEWLHALISVLPPDSTAMMVLDGQTPMALLGVRTARRRRILPTRQWVLNESGDPMLDRVAIEYNGPLTETDDAPAAVELFGALMQHKPGVDELVIRNATAGASAALRKAAAKNGWGVRLTNSAPSAVIDLNTVRASGRDIVSTSGRNTRAAVRRAFRLYEQHGPIRTDRAASASEAIEWFERMKSLHIASRRNRTAMHAFSNPAFEPFHRVLIRTSFERDRIDMLRVSAGNQDIGYLYNFSNDGWSMAYQSGFAPAPDNRWKPGLVSHCAAIAFSMNRGDYRYDFLAGPARYKNSLANNAIHMESLVAFAPRWHLKVENNLRRWRASWKARRLGSARTENAPGDAALTN